MLRPPLRNLTPVLALVFAAACSGSGSEQLETDSGNASTQGPRITTPGSGDTDDSTPSDVTVELTSTSGAPSTPTDSTGRSTTTTSSGGRRPSTTATTVPRNPEQQQIVFGGPPADWRYGQRATIGLTATSGLALRLRTSGPCTVVHEALHVLEATGVGECVLTATQPGDATYAPAAPVTARLTIRRAPTEIGNFQNASYEYLGQNTITFSATASSGVPAQYATNRAGCVMSPPGSATLQFQGTDILPITCDVTVSFGETPTHEAASLTRSFTLEKTNMTIDVVIGSVSAGQTQVTVNFNHATRMYDNGGGGVCDVGYDSNARATTHSVTVSRIAPPPPPSPTDPTQPPATSCSVTFGNEIPDGSVRSVTRTVNVPLA
jgi:hypothetical protein